MSEETDEIVDPIDSCEDCEIKELNILNKVCLKKKLTEWFSENTIYDLLFESGASPYSIKYDFDTNFTIYSESLLLRVINQLFYKSFENSLIKPFTLANIVEQLNKCVITPNFSKIFEFNSYGVLTAFEESGDNTLSLDKSDSNSVNIVETKTKMQNYLENKAESKIVTEQLIYDMLRVVKYRTSGEKGLTLPDDSTPRGDIVIDTKLAQVIDILIELN